MHFLWFKHRLQISLPLVQTQTVDIRFRLKTYLCRGVTQEVDCMAVMYCSNACEPEWMINNWLSESIIHCHQLTNNTFHMNHYLKHGFPPFSLQDWINAFHKNLQLPTQAVQGADDNLLLRATKQPQGYHTGLLHHPRNPKKPNNQDCP